MLLLESGDLSIVSIWYFFLKKETMKYNKVFILTFSAREYSGKWIQSRNSEFFFFLSGIFHLKITKMYVAIDFNAPSKLFLVFRILHSYLLVHFETVTLLLYHTEKHETNCNIFTCIKKVEKANVLPDWPFFFHFCSNVSLPHLRIQ